MKTFVAFSKKEVLEQMRSNKLLILTLLFLFIGILNPLTALITPWIFEMLSESLEGSGIIISDMKITALDSWVQFFKNIPIALIVFILMQSSLFSKEYQNGTLNLVLTKGFERYKVVLSKFLVLSLIWTIGYWLCFVVTYSYNAYYWDNSIANNLLFSGICWYILGIFVLSLFTLFSILTNTSSSSLALTGLLIFGLYLISLMPKIGKHIPLTLNDGNSLIYGLKESSYYIPSLLLTIVLTIVFLVISIISFHKKKF